jgi:amino acid transporter
MLSFWMLLFFVITLCCPFWMFPLFDVIIFVINFCYNFSFFFFCWKRGTLKERRNAYPQKTYQCPETKRVSCVFCYSLLVTFYKAAFFSRLCWNLRGMCTLVKTKLHVFCFSLVIKTTKIFALESFRVFLTVPF